MRTLRLSWLFFKVGAMNELQYRVNFVLQLFQSVLALGVGLVVLALVYSHTESLNGWSEDELLAVLGHPDPDRRRSSTRRSSRTWCG